MNRILLLSWREFIEETLDNEQKIQLNVKNLDIVNKKSITQRKVTVTTIIVQTNR